MNNFFNTALGSYVKVFLATILSSILFNLSNGQTVFEMDWKQLVSGAVVSILPVIINWLNPKDLRYGSKKVKVTKSEGRVTVN